MSERGSGFLLGLVLGMVLGATLMIFFAPASGEVGLPRFCRA